MHVGNRLLVASVVALLLSAITGAASASRAITVLNGERLTVEFPELTINAAGGRIICPTNLSGAAHRSIPKTEGALAGVINTVVIPEPAVNCEVEGLVTAVTSISSLTEGMHVQYRSFEGALPNITGLRFTVVDLRLLAAFRALLNFTCLYVFNQDFIATVGAEGGGHRTIRTARLVSRRIREFVLLGSLNACPEVELSGTGAVIPIVRVRLT